MHAGEVSTLAGDCGHQKESNSSFTAGIEDVACLADCTLLVTDTGTRQVHAVAPGSACPAHAGGGFSGALLGGASAAALAAGAALALGLPLAAAQLVQWRLARKRAVVNAASTALVSFLVLRCVQNGIPAC